MVGITISEMSVATKQKLKLKVKLKLMYHFFGGGMDLTKIQGLGTWCGTIEKWVFTAVWIKALLNFFGKFSPFFDDFAMWSILMMLGNFTKSSNMEAVPDCKTKIVNKPVSGKSITMTTIAVVSIISIGISIGFRFGIGRSFSHMIDGNGCSGPGSSVRWEWG